MSTLGERLINLCKDAKNEILLVSPFIKVDAMLRVVETVKDGVKMCCVTRWHPIEVACGVSDTDIWPLLKNRKDFSLWLCSNLHAKYYRADEKCLVGSANLTTSGLGWSKLPNLELLLSVSPSENDLQNFEKNLFNNSIRVDQSIYEQMLEAVDVLSREDSLINSKVFKEQMAQEILFDDTARKKLWLPSLRNPEELFVVYSGNSIQLTNAGRLTAETDLACLAIVPGMPKLAFERYVGILLLQQPLIKEVDLFVQVPRRFGAVKRLLANLCKDVPDFDATRSWQTLIRWLLYFLPDRYELSTPRYSEIICRKI